MYAGIYIQRTKVVASVGPRVPAAQIEPEDVAIEVLAASEDTTAASLLEDAVRWIVGKAKDVSRVGVGAYGPFVTLRPDQTPVKKNQISRYGELADTADPPFRGQPLYHTLRKLFYHHGKEPDIVIQTDANVAGLAEVYLEGKRPDPVGILFCLLVVERIGGGIVRGGHVVELPLHPEVGLMFGRLHPDDPLAKDYRSDLNRGRLSDLASVTALTERAEKLKIADRSLEALVKLPKHKMWECEVYYLAQLCLNATAMLAPSRIVLAGQLIEAYPGLVSRVDKRFREMLPGDGMGPMLDYPAIRDKAFIRGPFVAGSSYLGPLYLAAMKLDSTVVEGPKEKP